MKRDGLQARLKAIQWTGVAIFVVTALLWLVIAHWRVWLNGLLLGELGGAVVVLSMIRGGQPDGRSSGAPLFLSGMLGMVIRFAALVVVMVIAAKWRHIFNPYMALVGFLFGFVLIFAGLYGYAKNQDTTSSESR